MNPIAQQLNKELQAANTHVYDMLSDLGKSLYFPKGILTQSAEAKQKAHRFNATIGIATEEDKPLYLPLLQETLAAYKPQDIYPYAPPAGKAKLRKVWREKMLEENPSLKGKTFSNPIVTNALTQASGDGSLRGQSEVLRVKRAQTLHFYCCLSLKNNFALTLKRKIFDCPEE